MTTAAKILGVGRLALSNLPNGKVSLSPEMAPGVEKAFGVKMETLLRMQTRYNAYQRRQREGEVDVGKYVAA